MRLKTFLRVAALAAILPAAAHAQVIAVKAGRLIDTAAGTAATNQVILVEGGKIKAVGVNQGVVHAREILDAGFTTVRDVGNAGNK